MWSYVVVKQLIACQDGAIFSFKSSHDLLAIADFSVHPFHTVIVVVVVALQSDVSDVLGSSFKP